MPRFNPLPKVKGLKFSQSAMEQINLQAIFEQIQSLEQRVGVLQAENNNLNDRVLQQQQQPQVNLVAAAHAGQAQDDIFKIPDPIKSLPTFDGKRNQATAWIQTVRRTLALFRNRVSPDTLLMYEQCIINKITGEARDTLCSNGNPQTFDDAANVLLNSFGDKNTIATYQTQIWNMRMEESLHVYHRKAKEMMVNIKSLAKEDVTYAAHWDAINQFIEKECLAAFINGLRKPYFGYAQTAQPDNLEAAYAFLCRFQCAETTKKFTSKSSDTPHFSKQTSKNNFRQNSEQFKPNFSKSQENFQNNASGSQRFRPQSDRHKASPMEVDSSLKSRQNRIYNNDAEKEEDNEQAIATDTSDSEEESNFQVATMDNTLK